MRFFVGGLLALVGFVMGVRFLADVPEGTSGAFLVGYLAIPALMVFMGLRTMFKRK